MALNYAKGIPVDNHNNPMQSIPAPVTALFSTAMTTATSSVMSFGNNSTDIEVAAPNAAVAIKWITTGNTNASVITAVGPAHFDHVVPAASFRRFVIPRETQGATGVVGAGSLNGLYQRLAVIPMTSAIASILVTEY